MENGKLSEKLIENKALEQLREREYHKKYIDKFNEIYLIGIVFSEKEKNIIQFDYERIK